MTSQLIPQQFSMHHNRSKHEATVIDMGTEALPMEISDDDYLDSHESSSEDVSYQEPLGKTESESESKLDIRDMFMVMPKRREKIQRLKVTRVRFKSYRKLQLEIKFLVMRHTNPNDPPSLILSDREIAELWKTKKSAVLKGIQEQQVSEFMGLFEIVRSKRLGEIFGTLPKPPLRKVIS